MNDKEKKAIQYLENLDIDYNTLFRINLKTLTEAKNTLLKLIKNQELEIEKKNEQLKDWKMEYNHWCQLAIDRKRELEKRDKIQEEDVIYRDKYNKTISFFKNFIQNEENKVEEMEKENEEFYKDDIEQKQLEIQGFRNILKLLENQ